MTSFLKLWKIKSLQSCSTTRRSKWKTLPSSKQNKLTPLTRGSIGTPLGFKTTALMPQSTQTIATEWNPRKTGISTTPSSDSTATARSNYKPNPSSSLLNSKKIMNISKNRWSFSRRNWGSVKWSTWPIKAQLLTKNKAWLSSSKVSKSTGNRMNPTLRSVRFHRREGKRWRSTPNWQRQNAIAT